MTKLIPGVFALVIWVGPFPPSYELEHDKKVGSEADTEF